MTWHGRPARDPSPSDTGETPVPQDTIVAFATGVAPAARIVVRTSGPNAVSVAADLCDVPASAGHVTVAFAGVRCPAWVYVFRGPRSYTGEDVVEYGLPGSPVLARMFYDALLARGLRPAEPGEFTARAYFAGKLGLTEAEGVAATIAAGNADELAAARQLMAGELARRLRPVTDLVADTLALVEVGHRLRRGGRDGAERWRGAAADRRGRRGPGRSRGRRRAGGAGVARAAGGAGRAAERGQVVSAERPRRARAGGRVAGGGDDAGRADGGSRPAPGAGAGGGRGGGGRATVQPARLPAGTAARRRAG